MHRPAERLHLPVLHTTHAGRRDRFGLRPPTKYDSRVRHAPSQSEGSELHDRIGHVECDTMAGRSRDAPPRFPSRPTEPIDSDRVRAERDPRSGRLHDGAISSDGQRRRHIAHGVLGFEPVHEPRGGGLPHAVFLQRVADEPATSPEVRLGQGAFLALRFVDLLAPDREPPTPDVFRYQWAATERYCAELAGEGTEAAHLSCIVRATGEAHRTKDVHSVAPALFAYALYLERSEEHTSELQSRLHLVCR